MIYSITGKIIHKTAKFVVVENGGIGYKIFSSENILAGLDVGRDVNLYTHLHVREDILDLYGFLDSEDKDFFEMLISISGIGPKGALGILSVAPTKMLKSAILAGDSSIMTKVSGIGSKTAAKIVLELKSKLASSMSKEDQGAYLPEDVKKDMDVIDALVGLGYNQAKAREALKNAPVNFSTEEKIKHCLKQM
jgi:holliday junction DNA helicase RuvA